MRAFTICKEVADEEFVLCYPINHFHNTLVK